MNKIDLKINKNGRIVCLIEKNNKSKYVDYKNVLEYISSIRREKGIKLSIINNTISFSNNNMIVTIDNYSENKDINLQVIIEALIKEKIKRRNEYLRRKKIKREKLIRTSVLLGTLTIATTVTVTGLISGLIKKTNVEEQKFLDDKLSITLVEDESNIMPLYYESVENSKYSDEQVNTLEIKEDCKIIEVDYEKRTETEKFKKGKRYYNDIISYYSNMYGIDPQIMLAIAVQESGEHRINQDTPAIGLMQIEKAVWLNQDITGFNYKSGNYETLHITEEKLNNLEFNIRVACMHFQQCLKNSKNNLEVAIQMYNYGYGNINTVFKAYSNGKITLSNVEDLNGNEWLNYRKIINTGDPLYLEHVLSYIENPEDMEFILDNQRCKFSIKNIKEKNYSF